MAQVEIDTPMTGSDVEVSFSVEGWATPTTGSSVSCTITIAQGQMVNVGSVQVFPPGNWSIGPVTPLQVPAGSSVSITANVSVGGTTQSSDTTDNITVYANNDPIVLNPVPIPPKRKPSKTAVQLPITGTYDMNLKAVSIQVEVLVFQVWKKGVNLVAPKYEVYSVNTANKMSGGKWSATVQAPAASKSKRIVVKALLLDANNVVLGLTSQKQS